MAKPYQNATLICTILTIVALIGLILGFFLSQPLVPLILLAPTVIYEVYRTEGVSTKFASWGLLILLVLELALIFANIEFNVADFLGRTSTYIRGYEIPFGDVKVISPTLMALLCVILVTNTRGKYTRWLAGIIFVTSFAIIHLVDPNLFSELMRLAVNQGLDYLR